ncbi:hypothetical protein RJJ37_01310 [Rhizobium redzepovicii]|uniref:Uncharacterized protein n=1 Tax=Rhizobium redzepovicii TaxID=2867518 RepID=A0AAW8NTL8_9HYPH|nr:MULTISPECIES: hypothetical protein [Rhizobium]MDF0657982.1 hypothetical protein [Rhizobium sp. BC49]MDR9758277.1 hypothetical protein [Rhizobium redzepovicii]ULJ77106.1 hypothetical protein MF410_13580 [Rhizobium sp. C104]
MPREPCGRAFTISSLRYFAPLMMPLKIAMLQCGREALEKVGLAEAEERRTIGRRLISLVKIVWTVSIVMTATALGAHYGWESHGIAGALALGFVGLVAGGFLSSPSILLEVLDGLT